MRDVCLIALGGALGAVSRYALDIWSTRTLGPHFPYGTLLVNVLGCFIMGLVMQAARHNSTFSVLALPAFTVGFLGALTTFSAFGYATFDLFQKHSHLFALINILANFTLCLLAVWGGTLTARRWFAGG